MPCSEIIYMASFADVNLHLIFLIRSLHWSVAFYKIFICTPLFNALVLRGPTVVAGALYLCLFFFSITFA